MLQATTVTTEDELIQIHHLNQQNLKQNLSNDERQKEGFVTWLYSMELLKQMHALAPSVIVKDADKVVGYALVTPIESAVFHTDLQMMIDNLQSLVFNNKPMYSYTYYCMGQICINKAYRGQGIFYRLYNKHKEVYSSKFDLLVTEISTSNLRSLKAHENVGFVTINTYRDKTDEWNVVIWDWK